MSEQQGLGLEDSPFSDFLGFELLLEEQDRELLSSVRAFMNREVEPIINEYWTRAEFPHELLPGIAKLGTSNPPIAAISTIDTAPVPFACSCVWAKTTMQMAKLTAHHPQARVTRMSPAISAGKLRAGKPISGNNQIPAANITAACSSVTKRYVTCLDTRASI